MVTTCAVTAKQWIFFFWTCCDDENSSGEKSKFVQFKTFHSFLLFTDHGAFEFTLSDICHPLVGTRRERQLVN